MAGTTTKGLRYPTASDAPAIHTAFLNLASDVDLELDDYVATAGGVFTANPTVPTGIIFEGSTADAFETTLSVTDPTADRTIILPNSSGTVALTSDIVPSLTNENHARATVFMLGGM